MYIQPSLSSFHCFDVGGDETAPGTESATENGEETAATADSTAADTEQVKPEAEVKTDPQQQTEAGETEEKGAADAQESEKVSVRVIDTLWYMHRLYKNLLILGDAWEAESGRELSCVPALHMM